MRTGRNNAVFEMEATRSLDHWDMRTGRNAMIDLVRELAV